MNRLSYNNNFNGIIETGEEFVGAFEESSNHTSLIVNLITSEGTNYSLFIQQSNSNLTPKNNEENIGVGQPILLRTKYFRIILKNEEETNIKVDLHTNLFSQNLTSVSGGGTEVDTSLLASEATVKKIETAVNAIDFHYYDSQYKNDLRIKRREGKCFGSYFQAWNVTGTQTIGCIYNPVGNTKNLYVYQISYSNSLNEIGERAQMGLIRLHEPTFSGTYIQPGYSNMRFNQMDPLNDKTASLSTPLDSTNYVVFSQYNYMFESVELGANGNHVVLDFQEEFIEIYPGGALELKAFIGGGGNTDNRQFITANIRWYEEEISE